MKVLEKLGDNAYLVEVSSNIGAVIAISSWFKRRQWPSDIGRRADLRTIATEFDTWEDINYRIGFFKQKYSLEKIVQLAGWSRQEISIEEYHKISDEIASYKDDILRDIIKGGDK